MSAAAGVWLAIWLLRGLSSSRNGGGPPPSRRRDEVDGWLALVLFVEALAVIVGCGVFDGGWPLFFVAAVVLPFGPPWLLWRVCLPRRLHRPGRWLVYLLWTGAAGREGRRRLFEWSLPGIRRREAFSGDVPITFPSRRDAGIVPADGWTTCALALLAEAVGTTERADRLARGLAELPPFPRLSGTVRRIGCERLASWAVARGDWPAVLARAGAGRGRGCRFLRLLARAHLTHDVPAGWLWLAWLLAPERRRHRAWVKEALAAPSIPATPAAAPGDDESAWAAHLRLLDAATGGARVDRTGVLELARRWDEQLDGRVEAGLTARALELGVVAPSASAGAVRAGVLADLEALAGAAEGPWPDEWPDDDGLAADLYGSVEDRLFRDLDAWVRPYRRGEETEIGYPLVEWERWLNLRAAVDRLEEVLGPHGLSTAWRSGLRLAVWNWPCRLLDLHRTRAAWACQVMFEWTVAAAERFGDTEAADVNRRNVEAARQQLSP